MIAAFASGPLMTLNRPKPVSSLRSRLLRGAGRSFSGDLLSQFSGISAVSLLDAVLDQFSRALDFGIRKMLHSDKEVLRRARADQFVEFNLDRRVVSVLGVESEIPSEMSRLSFRCL